MNVLTAGVTQTPENVGVETSKLVPLPPQKFNPGQGTQPAPTDKVEISPEAVKLYAKDPAVTSFTSGHGAQVPGHKFHSSKEVSAPVTRPTK